MHRLSKERLYDLIVATAPDGIITSDASGAILSFSPSAEEMFGYTEAELIGENLRILMPAGHAARHDGYMRRYLRTGEKRIIGIGREVQARRRNGEVFVAELAIGELKLGEEHVFTGFIRDMSDRAAAQAKARKLQRSLDQLTRTRLIGEMSTAMAHEINQPLAAISNFARAASRLLADGAGDREKAASYLDKVAEQAKRAGEIIRRMRRLVDRGDVDLRPDDINEIVREAIRLDEAGSGSDDVRISVELGLELPPVMVDRIQIQQVILNLLRNAREALEPAEDGVRRITTSATRGRIEMKAKVQEAGQVMVTVSDTGPGLPSDILQSLFEPLVTTKDRGIGVGLAICRSIVHAHGGRIWAENNAAGGADVHFTLQTAPT
ncbi:PAS domain S-box protein [Pikeienuella piscinae]|uniref:Sensor protein FixL n=1 Tax=Pikeienuella piscinae TaxID=2748098 RepID=A0A7L5BSN5_9RHOB|nr:PAS domain S-box protein [Pikeienuella piscinae]QIE54195.1 PAS domain S-box protein [Pikeienuella piscinae]